VALFNIPGFLLFALRNQRSRHSPKRSHPMVLPEKGAKKRRFLTEIRRIGLYRF
jgi:hypothetical protein